jgi:hypothetical protein
MKTKMVAKVIDTLYLTANRSIDVVVLSKAVGVFTVIYVYNYKGQKYTAFINLDGIDTGEGVVGEADNEEDLYSKLLTVEQSENSAATLEDKLSFVTFKEEDYGLGIISRTGRLGCNKE